MSSADTARVAIPRGLISLRSISDERGTLTFFEEGQDIPFPIRRVYYIRDVPRGASRGHHAHKKLRRLIVAMHGSVRVTLDDGERTVEFHLSDPSKGLYVGPGLWIELNDFSPGSVCCVFASDLYDEDDYIRSRKEFLMDAAHRRQKQ